MVAVALHLSPFAMFAFHSAPLAKRGTRVGRGVSFEAAPRTTSATAASSSAAAAALASASLPSKEESWAFPYDLLAHIGR